MTEEEDRYDLIETILRTGYRPCVFCRQGCPVCHNTHQWFHMIATMKRLISVIEEEGLLSHQQTAAWTRLTIQLQLTTLPIEGALNKIQKMVEYEEGLLDE